jgi:hypothetical protein
VSDSTDKAHHNSKRITTASLDATAADSSLAPFAALSGIAQRDT